MVYYVVTVLKFNKKLTKPDIFKKFLGEHPSYQFTIGRNKTYVKNKYKGQWFSTTARYPVSYTRETWWKTGTIIVYTFHGPSPKEGTVINLRIPNKLKKYGSFSPFVVTDKYPTISGWSKQLYS